MDEMTKERDDYREGASVEAREADRTRAALAKMTEERDGLLTQIGFERNEIRVRQKLLDEATAELAALKAQLDGRKA